MSAPVPDRDALTAELHAIQGAYHARVQAAQRRHLGLAAPGAEAVAARSFAIEVVPLAAMAYPSCDDYVRDPDGRLRLTIADTGDRLYNGLLLVHALLEALIAEAQGVAFETITAFDLGHPDAAEPGEYPAAPYRDAHLFAKGVEMQACAILGIPWVLYEAHLEKLFAAPHGLETSA